MLLTVSKHNAPLERDKAQIFLQRYRSIEAKKSILNILKFIYFTINSTLGYDNEIIPNLCATQYKKEWWQTLFTYKEDGISIQIPNVYAWVCPEDGEASFTPENC